MNTDAIIAAFRETRAQSLSICAPLTIEDYGLQAAVFASPPKWHLAHTTWFFETFILKFLDPAYQPSEPLYEKLFNSYYNGIGEPHPRERRGLLSRPGLAEVLEYRQRTEAALEALIARSGPPQQQTLMERLELGTEHERQHQELFFTDLKYSLSANPLYPAYMDTGLPEAQATAPLSWTGFDGGLVETGFSGDGFCFDNELPRHRCYLEPYALANRLVSNAEFQAFIDDGGYRRPELWLADGWALVQAEGWAAPLHWLERDGQGLEFTLYGLRPRDAGTPVCHVSGYEADAYARWADARLPTEAEWEHAAAGTATAAGGLDAGVYHPRGGRGDGLVQLYGDCWQWTRSAYGPYPGYRPAAGAIGEYNGKFMSNQWVLRGGSCVTKASQARPTYRNFFYPRDRWQFSGIRLAREGIEQ